MAATSQRKEERGKGTEGRLAEAAKMEGGKN
jgi:hypothetical protein